MRVARYIGGGEIAIVEEPIPSCPPGGLLIGATSCGLCSGELMSWYMDKKIPHVLGHEVSGQVIASEAAQFPVGAKVFPHHHAPCMSCDFCAQGRYVHCAQWKRTKLNPGGMADFFAVAAENLTDTLLVDDLRPIDAALIEPIACMVKSIRAASTDGKRPRDSAVIGLGTMGLMHMLSLDGHVRGYDLNPSRVEWTRNQGLSAHNPEDLQPAETVFVCPGSQAAFDTALSIVRPGGVVVMFAPLPPQESLRVPQDVYFRDIRIVHSYSCGPNDTRAAREILRQDRIKAEQVCSHFIELEELPEKYGQMKRGEILKPMVVWQGQESSGHT